ncbi:60 kDa chaperonin [Stieleria bergensis]|uniref:Chaperonin GroEL n=1 Tax=Stieleria bergensis TaxID=2528025 RepID=A0A517T2B7_9BACT|nr:60 kDa chaperonin [Planctomycetes bacterium SV_7m_r]
MSKLLYHDEAREAIRRGVGQLARTVRSTLGPCGHTVMLANSFGPPTVTKDGVTVADAIDLDDADENIGVKMVREVASKTNQVAGDGTTTATVLADAIFNEGLRAVVAGVNPVGLKSGIEKATADVVRHLQSRSVAIKGQKAMAQVASIAANNDLTIGKVVADALQQVGSGGIVTIEDGKAVDNEVNWVKGMQFDNGYLSPYFVNHPESMECVLEDPYVLIHEAKISNVQEFLPLLEKVAAAGRPLLIVAEDVEGEALTTLVINGLRGTFTCCAVKSPGYGDRRKEMMEDIAIMTGGNTIAESLGLQLKNLGLDSLGRAKKVIIDKDHTTIIDGAGTKSEIQARIAQIDSELEKATQDYDQEKLRSRKAKLCGGVATISVGGATESEVKEKKLRFEDALNATRAAAEEGVLPGGGVALMRAAAACKPAKLSDGEQVGYDIVLRACRSPLIWIAENAGGNGRLIHEKVAAEKGNYGYNAAEDRFEDLVVAGIIDPAKVVRCALQNAASVSTLLLTSDVLITNTK